MTANLLRFLGWPIVAGVIAAIILLWLLPTPNNTNNPAPQSEPFSYADAVSRAAPSVVNIYTRKRIQRANHPLLDDPVLRRLTNSTTPRTRESIGLGSGVILSKDGYIITNLHILTSGNPVVSPEVYVQLHDGRTTTAKIIGKDKVTDLAVLKIDLDSLTPASIGDAMKAQVGDVVLAIGNPHGVGQTVTQGIISASGAKDFGRGYQESIQTDAAINPGNSGGALIDAHGNLLGINSLTHTSRRGINHSYGISFAIPVNTTIKVLEDIRQHGQVIRGFIGEITINDLSKMQLHELGLEIYQSGLRVNDLSDSPASSAGLRMGDIIIGINGQRRTDPAYRSKIMIDLAPQDSITLDIMRGNKELQITIIASVAPALAR